MDADIPFYSTIGIEYTYLWHKKEDQEGLENYRVEACGNNLLADFREKLGKEISVVIDEQAVEIRSPVFSTMAELELFQKQMEELVVKYPLVTHREDTYSGGGHIHFGLKKEMLENPHYLLLFLTNLFRDVTNRPYLNWMFNEWSNLTSAKSFVTYKHKPTGFNPHDYVATILFDQSFEIPQTWTTSIMCQVFDCWKGYALRLDQARGHLKKKATVEFRLFDAKRNIEETRAHVNFVNRYVQYIDTLTRKGEVIWPLVQRLEDFRFLHSNDHVLPIFQELIGLLGLRWNDYLYFVVINYLKRKRAGILEVELLEPDRCEIDPHVKKLLEFVAKIRRMG